MRLAGLNGREIKEGVNRRSLDKSATDWEDNKNDSFRGPVCPEFIASFIVAIAGNTLERVFNKIISLLAANSFFPRKIKVLLDASDLESTERCEGRGKVTKEKAPELRRRGGRVKKIRVTVFGFKIWVVWDPNSALPIAMHFATIDTSDITLARDVIEHRLLPTLENMLKLSLLPWIAVLWTVSCYGGSIAGESSFIFRQNRTKIFTMTPSRWWKQTKA